MVNGTTTRILKDYRLASLAGGAIFPLGLSPVDFWPVTLISVAIFWWLLKTYPDKGARVGWFYGLAVFLSGASWIKASMAVANTPEIIALVLTFLFCAGMALFFAFKGWLMGRLTVKSGSMNAFTFAGIWVLGDWIQSWAFTGFPWLYAGYAFTDTWLAGFAGVFGVFGVTFVVIVLTAAIAGQIWAFNRFKTALIFIWGIMVIGAGAYLQSITWTTDTENSLDIAIVQGNVDQRTKWYSSNIRPNFENYVELSRPHLDADLIIWPEAAITAMRSDADVMINYLDYLGHKDNTGFITGIISDQISEDDSERLAYYNSAIGLGLASGEYHKQRMVPFGEYVPFAGLIRNILDFFNLPMSVLEAGPETPSISQGSIKISILICYEIAYPELSRLQAKQADILVTISNDAWFGDSFGPYQHLQIARFRALETGKPVIRATQDGVSAFINSKGQVEKVAEKFQRTVIRQKIYPATGQTPYAKYGHLWIVLILALYLFLVFWRTTATFKSISANFGRNK